MDAFKPMGLSVAYDAAKADLATVARSMAKELTEHGIVVKSVASRHDDHRRSGHQARRRIYADEQVTPGADKTRDSSGPLVTGPSWQRSWVDYR